jgi:hypothetical protein
MSVDPLPIVTRTIWEQEPRELDYSRYTPDYQSDHVLPVCSGLVLVLAGHGIFRRIGYFRDVHQSEVTAAPEQEIKIV